MISLKCKLSRILPCLPPSMFSHLPQYKSQTPHHGLQGLMSLSSSSLCFSLLTHSDPGHTAIFSWSLTSQALTCLKFSGFVILSAWMPHLSQHGWLLPLPQWNSGQRDPLHLPQLMSLTPSSRILYFITLYNFLHSSYQHLKLYAFTCESNTSISFVHDCSFLWFRRVSGTWSVPSSEYLSSVAQSCPTLCNPMDCSTPSFSVHHQLPELAQTHVHQVGDAIQPSHLLSSPSPPAFNLSQHQGLFQ